MIYHWSMSYSVRKCNKIMTRTLLIQDLVPHTFILSFQSVSSSFKSSSTSNPTQALSLLLLSLVFTPS
ncbi:hypothetical protein PMAYCL1PPCAC_18414, partial [Pristionchus mayeri]